MKTESDIIRDPQFRQLLAQRSRWRWGLSGGLIGLYFAYCLAGIYYTEAFSRPAIGTSITWSIALGYLIILLAIVLSIVYIRIVGRLTEQAFRDAESDQ